MQGHSGPRLLALLVASAACAISIPAHAQSSTEAAQAQVTTAATPPMGWNPWNAFRTDVDEARLLEMAALMVKDGLVDAGYQYVNIDDGWAMRRDADGKIEVRTSTFPSAKLADGGTSFRPWVEKLHSMGLKAGIYTDIGRNTCAQVWDADAPNQPEGTQDQRQVGAYGYESQDADLFVAKWGFDYVKIDACGVADYGAGSPLVADGKFKPFAPQIFRGHPQATDARGMEALYDKLTAALRHAAPGAAPVLSICAWGEGDVSDWAGQYGHLWRTSGDIRNTWKAVMQNFDSAAPRALFAGPGRWNDPDLMNVGNGEFGPDHLDAARSHMALWSIIAAPLFISLDLSKASPEILKVIGNREVIAINQDPAGNQGVIVRQEGGQQIIVKQMADGSKAVTLTNRGDGPQTITLSVADINLDPTRPVRVRDLWTHKDRNLKGGSIEARLAPRETMMLRLYGSPAKPGSRQLFEMPARFRVAVTGYKPSDRSLANPWIPARIGYYPSGQPVMVNGKHDLSALAAGGGARIEIALNGEFKRFRAMPDQPGPVLILGDGKELYSGDEKNTKPIDIPLDGVKVLTISLPPATGAATVANSRVLLGTELQF